MILPLQNKLKNKRPKQALLWNIRYGQSGFHFYALVCGIGYLGKFLWWNIIFQRYLSFFWFLIQVEESEDQFVKPHSVISVTPTRTTSYSGGQAEEEGGEDPSDVSVLEVSNQLLVRSHVWTFLIWSDLQLLCVSLPIKILEIYNILRFLQTVKHCILFALYM